MSRKRNHRMRPELRQRQQRGETLAISSPERLAALCRPLTPEAVAARMVEVNKAVVLLLEGTADPRHMDELGRSINIAWVRIEQLADQLANPDDLRAALEACSEALEEARQIHVRHGRYGLTGPGRQRLQPGIDAYEAVITVSSPKELSDAEDVVIRAHRMSSQRKEKAT